LEEDLNDICALAGQALDGDEITEVMAKTSRVSQAFGALNVHLQKARCQNIDLKCNLGVALMHYDDLNDAFEAMKREFIQFLIFRLFMKLETRISKKKLLKNNFLVKMNE
jgi:hypothetical protein